MDYGLNVGRMTLQNYVECKDLAHPLQVVHVGKDGKDCYDIIPNATAAFLGPNLWDDSKVDYIDLDSFLEPNPEEGQLLLEGTIEQNVQNRSRDASHMHLPVMQSSDQSPPREPTPLNPLSIDEFSNKDDTSRTFPVDCKFSPSDLALATPPGHKHYDPAKNVLPEEELKPQPMIKKSRKNFVPDNMKDSKYWARRIKNNIAAKRSREARRVKENQIVLRASYLEKENSTLKEDVMRLKAENDMLKSRLQEYES